MYKTAGKDSRVRTSPALPFLITIALAGPAKACKVARTGMFFLRNDEDL